MPACGGMVDAEGTSPPETAGSATVDGGVLGQRVGTESTFALIKGPTVLIAMDTVAGVCALLHEERAIPSNHALVLGLESAGAVPQPGSYPIPAAGSTALPSAAATYSVSDSQCKGSIVMEAESGVVELDDVSGALVTGRFDVTMYSGDRVSGTFSAPICDAPLTADGPWPCGP
jgi:hypothetical protein